MPTLTPQSLTDEVVSSPSSGSSGANMPVNGQETLIEVVGLARSYGDLQAVNNVSFSIKRGEVVGFLGPNGAGKSTTMQMLAGTLAPSAGTIRINGIDLLDTPLLAKARIGYLPEQPPLYREQSVDELLCFCASLRGVKRRERAKAVSKAKAQTGLDATGSRIIGNLSKGYQQRVGIAQALVHEPNIVILDEPTSGLDPNQLRDIRALIRDLGERRCVILSSHILAEIQTVCDRVLLMNHGEIMLDQTLAHATQAATTKHLVRLRYACTDSVLSALAAHPHIVDVHTSDTHCLVCEHDGRAATIDDIVAHVYDFGIRELTEQKQSLDELFMALTLGQPLAGVVANEAVNARTPGDCDAREQAPQDGKC